jgi:hypothetical protein
MLNEKKQFRTCIGTARYPWLKDADTAFGQETFKCQLILSEKEAEPLLEQIMQVQKDFGSKAEKAMLPVERDEETGDYIFKTKSAYQPKFWDSQGNPILPANLPDIWGGSRLKLSGWIAPWSKHSKVGITLQLMKVMIVEARGPSSDGGSQESGFDKEDGGFITEKSDQAFEDDSTDAPSYL